jgi:hypothetical protein
LPRSNTFRCDCQSIVQALQNAGSSKPGLAHLLRELSTLAATHGFDYRCEHIPGVDNTLADILSRDGDCAQFRAACPKETAALPSPTPLVPLPPGRRL